MSTLFLMLVCGLVSDMCSSVVWFFSHCSDSSGLCSDSCDHLWMWWSGPTDCCCLSTSSDIWNWAYLLLACEHLGWNCNRFHLMHTLISVGCLCASATHTHRSMKVYLINCDIARKLHKWWGQSTPVRNLDACLYSYTRKLLRNYLCVQVGPMFVVLGDQDFD